jgi:hypothetical protein
MLSDIAPVEWQAVCEFVRHLTGEPSDVDLVEDSVVAMVQVDGTLPALQQGVQT